MDNIKICCPKCKWEPDGKPYWQCSCGHQWDTFATGGCCPACKRVWKKTQCVTCNKWSLHLNWYHGLDDIIHKLKEELKKKWKEEPAQVESK